MNIFERTALGEHLTSWDESLTYDQILDEIEMDFTNDLDIVIWEQYQETTAQQLVNCIVNLRETLERNFVEKVPLCE